MAPLIRKFWDFSSVHWQSDSHYSTFHWSKCVIFYSTYSPERVYSNAWARRICAYIVKCLKIGSEVGGIIKLSILKIGNDEFKFANKWGPRLSYEYIFDIPPIPGALCSGYCKIGITWVYWFPTERVIINWIGLSVTCRGSCMANQLSLISANIFNYISLIPNADVGTRIIVHIGWTE